MKNDMHGFLVQDYQDSKMSGLNKKDAFDSKVIKEDKKSKFRRLKTIFKSVTLAKFSKQMHEN